MRLVLLLNRSIFAVTACLFVSTLYFSVNAYQLVPRTAHIPVHFDIHGVADNFFSGSRWVFMFPIMSLCLFASLLFIHEDAHFSMPTERMRNAIRDYPEYKRKHCHLLRLYILCELFFVNLIMTHIVRMIPSFVDKTETTIGGGIVMFMLSGVILSTILYFVAFFLIPVPEKAQ